MVNPLAQAVKKAKFDPDWFCERILGWKNTPWQSEFMGAIADLDRAKAGKATLFNHELLNRFTVRGMNGCRKTSTVANIFHWWMFTRYGRILATGPKLELLTHRVWPEFRKKLSRTIDFYPQLIEVSANKIIWAKDPDWFAVAETANQPENLQGHHHENLLISADEASGIKDEMFPAMFGSMTEPGAVLILTSNTIESEGEFFRSHKKKGTMELYYKIHVGPQHCPWISETESGKRWMDGLIRSYGKDSPVVQVRVFAEFVEMSKFQLIALSWIDSALTTPFETDGSLPRLRISADVANGGEDESVIVAARRYDSRIEVLSIDRFSFPGGEAPIDTALAAERIFKAHGGRPGEDDFVFDMFPSGGAGWLMKKGYHVIEHSGGSGSDDMTRWANRRTQSYISLRNALRDGTLFFAANAVKKEDIDDLSAQLCSIKYKEGQEKKEELQTKTDMQARGIKSPDIADALAMLFATQIPTVRPVDTTIFFTPGVCANQPDF